MIRDIDNLLNLRHCAFDDGFNTLFEREVCRAASLTTAMESYVNAAVLNIYDLYRPSVFGDAGIDLRVN